MDNLPTESRMSLEKIIHQVWLGGDLDKRTLDWMQSFRRFHSMDWSFRLWHEGNVHQLGLEPWAFEHSSFAGSANIIRLHALYQEGGIFADSDVECLKPLDKLLQYDAFAAQQPIDGLLCNAFAGATKGHPWIKWQIENFGDQRIHDASRGVYVMDEAPREGVTIIPTEWCYPFSWEDPVEDRKPHKDSLVQHWWAKSWVKNERGDAAAV